MPWQIFKIPRQIPFFAKFGRIQKFQNYLHFNLISKKNNIFILEAKKVFLPQRFEIFRKYWVLKKHKSTFVGLAIFGEIFKLR